MKFTIFDERGRLTAKVTQDLSKTETLLRTRNMSELGRISRWLEVAGVNEFLTVNSVTILRSK